MKIIKPSVEIVDQDPGLEGIYKQIEQAGRNCYQSSHLIGKNTARPFVERMIRDGHTAMLEHGTVYLLIPKIDAENVVVGNWILRNVGEKDNWVIRNYGENPYSVLKVNKNGDYCITTNYRVLVENKWLYDLEYFCEPTEDHARRITARFSTQIAISREYNRHRVNSIAEESTRYCNYSKGKYGSEITVCLPSCIQDDDASSSMPGFVEMCGFIHNGQDKIWDALLWWWFANLACEYSYMKLIEKGWTAQQARTVLPLDTKTTLVHTAFVSEWQHFFDLRSRGTTGKPHPDAKVLADQLLQMFIERGLVRE